MMRHERKYRIESESYQQVLQEVKSIYGAFDKTYPDRWINSIYLDTSGFSALKENLSGVSQRSKYRLRWYGENFTNIENPILEEKIKDNLLGYKKYKQLSSCSLSAPDIRNVLDLQELKDSNLQPVVLVRYQRTYLESFDHKVRATIDRNLEYRGVNNYNLDQHEIRDDAIILEVKYDKNEEEKIDHILQSIKYRLTKNSKFVHGVMGYWS